MKLTPERFMVDESVIDKDYTYLKQMSPDTAKELLDIIEDICDRLEYEGSFMYDVCPDKTTVLKLTDTIAEKISGMDSISLKDFIQVLLCDEILFRRCRYYRKKKMFEQITVA